MGNIKFVSQQNKLENARIKPPSELANSMVNFQQDKLRHTKIHSADSPHSAESEVAELVALTWFYPCYSTIAWAHLCALCVSYFSDEMLLVCINDGVWDQSVW